MTTTNPAIQYFEKQGMGGHIRQFDGSSATVELAAAAIGCQPEQIAKTLSFKQGDGCLLVVAAGDARIDNAKFKARFGMKATMLTAEQVLQHVGYPVGGVCPFALKQEVPVYLDESLKRFTTVFAACGSPNSVIQLTLEQLMLHSGSQTWVDVCKNWQ